MDSSWTFHHLGVAVPSIEKAAVAYTSLGYVFEAAFEDHTQGVRGSFFIGNGPRYELLEDLPDRQTVAPWILRRMPTVYHQAWLVPSISHAIDALRAEGARPTGDPADSVYFHGPIVFLMTKGSILVELIEPGPTFDSGPR
jgi:catechol 2,3-dioxygenase-like lactoylglutathione lyase family enzyme